MDFFSFIYHEILQTQRQTFAWLTPLFFFVLVVCLFPLALGSNAVLLNKIAPGIIWVTALLAVLISIGNLFKQDAQEGHLDLLLLSYHSLTVLMFLKIFSFWLMYCLPIILISPLLGILLNLNAHQEIVMIFSLLLGTPVLSMLGAIGAALVVGIQNGGLLLPVLIMPLYVPVLIFGTGVVSAQNGSESFYFAIMGAFFFLNLAFAPFLTGFALRIGVNQ